MENHNNVIAKGIRIGGLYKLDVKMESHHAMSATCVSIEELWHLQRKEMVQGLPIFKDEQISCDGCALGK